MGVGLAIAQVYSNTEEYGSLFTGRCYQYLALATWLHEMFDFSRGCVHVTPDEVRFRVRYYFPFSIFSADILRSHPYGVLLSQSDFPIWSMPSLVLRSEFRNVTGSVFEFRQLCSERKEI